MQSVWQPTPRFWRFDFEGRPRGRRFFGGARTKITAWREADLYHLWTKHSLVFVRGLPPNSDADDSSGLRHVLFIIPRPRIDGESGERQPLLIVANGTTLGHENERVSRSRSLNVLRLLHSIDSKAVQGRRQGMDDIIVNEGNASWYTIKPKDRQLPVARCNKSSWT